MRSPSRPLGNSGPSIVLVVEDEVLVRMGAVLYLEDAGFDVIEATNAGEALEVLDARSDVAVVFTDVNMPGPLDGLDLAWEVSRRRPDLPVIITSGRMALGEDQIPARSCFLAKPYMSQALTTMVAQAVETGLERQAA